MRFLSKFHPSPVLILFGILILAAGWKALLLTLGAFPFNADEAVVALMARHILQGDRPIFFYGQAYMGSLDAFLVAGGFLVFGQQVWVIRVMQTSLYLGLIITTFGLGKEVCGSKKVGLLAAGLMAIPTVNVTLYTTASLGGYGEALLIGNLILLCALRIANASRKEDGLAAWWLWAVWGWLAGLGLWANGLTLIYSLPAGILLLVTMIQNFRKAIDKNPLDLADAVGARGDLKRVGDEAFPHAPSPALLRNRYSNATIPLRTAVTIAGFFLGSLPWWLFAITQGWQSLFSELLGSAVAVEQEAWVIRTLNHLVSFVLLGGSVTLGLRPPWEIRWLALPLLPFVLIAWLGILALALSGLKPGSGWRGGRLLLLGMALTLSFGFIFTSFGVDPSGRYFIPLVVPLSLAAAEVIANISVKPALSAGLLVLLVVYQGWGTLDSALRNPPGITTQFSEITRLDIRYQDELIKFLKTTGETRGYSNYWVSYPTAFLSAEELIFVPRLPYHDDLRYTSRDDRYLPYDKAVAESSKIAYITARNPNLDQTIARGLTILGVTWQERQIGDYHVYFQLSKAVRPDEIGLGEQP
jgi:4-amino-4-deoxy-L-arabinose transferase-like glycosyltransferase